VKKPLAPSCFALLVLCLGVYPGGTHAGPTADPVPHGASSGFTAPLSGIDMLKIDDVSARDRARARQDSGQLLGALQLACEPSDAALVGRGDLQIDGAKTAVKVYEVACSNHVGYLLLAQGAQPPLALTCFAAAARHTADVAQGAPASPYCRLPLNLDLKAMAGAVATAAGRECTVSDLRWFGQNAASHIDYSEVACTDGHGYLLKVPEAGPAPELAALSCPEAALQGLKCHLTDAGAIAVPVTLQTFRDALKQHAVNCTPGQMRMIGRESVARRYVVEVQCPEQPKGLVAFVPVDDPASSFEAVDCMAAVERGVQCQYPVN
jgi:hypothetical protein